MTLRNARRLLSATLAAGLLALPATAGAQATGSTHHTGVLADGGSWIADVPDDWNGTLLLYSHGYGSNTPADSPNQDTQTALLDRGYALAGSSYDPAGSLWALDSAVPDQLETLHAVKRDVLPSKPHRVLAFGQSMGGLVSSLEAERRNRPINGALTTCGIVAGGVALENYQLRSEYTISRLLAPGQPIKLVDFASPADAALTAQQLNTAAQTAQNTAAGRARLALAMAFLNVATWAPGADMPAPGDYAEQERQQYDIAFGGSFPLMIFIETGRQQIELAAGGNHSWTAGVDFARLLRRSPYRRQVRALYRDAGVDLGADLASLESGANIRAKPSAVRWLNRTSVPSGRLAVPELDIHTISDQLVPVQQERHYRDKVRDNRARPLLRQAFVRRQNHCNFTPAEYVASVSALEHRVKTGRWDRVTRPSRLNAAASSLGLGESAFIRYRPGRLSGVDGW